MTLLTLSPDVLRGLACAVWLAVLIALLVRRPAWRDAPGGVRLILAGVAVIGAGLLIAAVFAALHRLAASPDRIAAEAISLVAGLFILAGLWRYRAPPLAPAAPSGASGLETARPEPAPAAPPPAPLAAEAAHGPPAAYQAWQINALERFQTEKQEAMTRLAGGLAHDFSNVLTVILTASEILLMDETLPEPLRRRIERMNGAAQRGADLTDQLRAFAGHQDLMAEVVDLHDLLRSDAVAFQAALGMEIELRYDFADGPCPVLVDPRQMCAAVMTVLVYCRSALPEGGCVVLDTRFEPAAMPGQPSPDQPSVDQLPLDGMMEQVVLTIARSGKRIPIEDAGRLLDEPYSLGTSSVTGGGFGLSLVAGFIRQSGGEVRFVDRSGEGPVLEIRLPLAIAEGLEDARNAGVSDLSASHVLLVEDNDLMREAVAAELTSLGCTVTVAASPAEALDRLERDGSIEAVVSDLTFRQGEDGHWFVREAQARFPYLRLVLMSGDITSEGVSDDGVNLLAKPFSRAQLAASLQPAK